MDLQLTLTGSGSLRNQLEEALREAIRSGRLPPDAPLPPSRVLAQELQISRGVVTEAYAQLVAEGHLTARRGSSTRVARLPAPWGAGPPPSAPPFAGYRFELRPGLGDYHAFPRRGWQAALLAAARELPDVQLTYSPHEGSPQLRDAVAAYLARARAAVAEPESVVITCGNSHGQLVLWSALARNGARRVAIEDPGWRWQRLTVEHAGLEAVPIAVDEEGLCVTELERLSVDAVVITPARQYPMGVAMPSPRRERLIAWARARGALIVEDDYDAEYRFDRDPVPSLQGLAPDCVAYLGTTSKTLAPALRLGWLVAPAAIRDDVVLALKASGVTPPTIDQAAMARFISDGALDRHLRAMRPHYRAKRDVMIEALTQQIPGARVGGEAAGLHLVAWLPAGIGERAVAIPAREAGVGLHELHRHCTTVAPRPPALLFGFALPSVADIRTATAIVGDVIRDLAKR